MMSFDDVHCIRWDIDIGGHGGGVGFTLPIS